MRWVFSRADFAPILGAFRKHKIVFKLHPGGKTTQNNGCMDPMELWSPMDMDPMDLVPIDFGPDRFWDPITPDSFPVLPKEASGTGDPKRVTCPAPGFSDRSSNPVAPIRGLKSGGPNSGAHMQGSRSGGQNSGAQIQGPSLNPGIQISHHGFGIWRATHRPGPKAGAKILGPKSRATDLESGGPLTDRGQMLGPKSWGPNLGPRIWDPKIHLPIGAQMSGAQMSGTQMSGAQMSGA